MSSIVVVWALYDYRATETDEINLSEGDEYKLLETYDDDWWLIEDLSGKKRGLAPSNYLDMENKSVLELSGICIMVICIYITF